MTHRTPSTAELVLAACGDIMLHGRYLDLAATGHAEDTFSELRGLIGDADLVIGNLETPLTDKGAPRDDKLCLRGSPAYADALAKTGFQVLSLGNNHCLDYGPEALAETHQHLRTAGIEATGAGADLTQAGRPLILQRNGIRVGLLAACDAMTKPAPPATPTSAGIHPLEPALLLPAIKALKPRVDHVVLLLHWGLEYSPMPTPEQVTFAHAACDHGASLILGHHSHCIQGIEHYGDAVIAYSLANLTDDGVDWQGPTRRYQAPLTEVDRESLLLRVRLGPERVEVIDSLPLWLDDVGRPTLAQGERATAIRDRIQARSAQIASTEDLEAYWQQAVIGRRVADPLLSWWRDGTLWDKIKRFRPGQIVSAWLLLTTFLRLRFTRSESRWLLFNSRNDTRPMPAVRKADRHD